MSFLKYSFIALLALVLIVSAGYLVASTGVKSQPGYAKLTLPNWSNADTTLAITVGPIGMKTVRWIAEGVVNVSEQQLELPEQILLKVAQDIEGAQLRVYEIENDRPRFAQIIDDSIGSLSQDGWQTLLAVRDKDERIVVMQSAGEGLIEGLMVLVSTPENAVFVNLVGQIEPEDIANYVENSNWMTN